MYLCCFFLVFFFKQKTAYEMRISDWSSDVCSSDLCGSRGRPPPPARLRGRHLPVRPCASPAADEAAKRRTPAALPECPPARMRRCRALTASAPSPPDRRHAARSSAPPPLTRGRPPSLRHTPPTPPGPG